MKNTYIVSDRLKAKLDTKKNRGRKLSSQMWLQRQLNDVYVKSAKAEGYYARSAYKLIEINNPIITTTSIKEYSITSFISVALPL